MKLILVGASIGNGWDLPNFPGRVNVEDISIDYRHGGSGFDKSEKIQEVIHYDPKPDYLIIKECAAYFPVEEDRYKDLIAQWLDLCRSNDITPILSTVVPVTKTHELKKDLFYFVRRRPNNLFKTNPFSYNKNKSIIAYNKWIRDFSKENGISLLDLASALTKEGSEFLNASYARIDGLHLNKKGYVQLDNLLENFIRSMI